MATSADKWKMISHIFQIRFTKISTIFLVLGRAHALWTDINAHNIVVNYRMPTLDKKKNLTQLAL